MTTTSTPAPTVARPDLTFDAYTSSSEGSVLVPRPSYALPELTEDPRVFDKARYATEVHPPRALFETGTVLHGRFMRCLDMPLRLAGDTEYRLPEEWTTLGPLIERILGVEHANNPNWARYHTYLTVDSSEMVADGQQRNGGLHADGFQGARITPKTKVTRNYVATSNGGTRFYPQLFRTGLDDAVFDLFKGFNLQAGRPVLAPEDTVVFMDAYTVHESGLAARDGLRTFLRVTFDLKKFDRAGNTHNAMLDYNWPMVERNVHQTLQAPTLEALYA